MELFEKYFHFRLFPSKEDPNRDVYESLVCGALSGIAAKTVIAPAERVKFSFQVTSAKFTWKNAFEQGRNVVHSQGWLGLWRGHSTTILRIAPYSALSFAFHDSSEQMFKDVLHTDVLPASYKFSAGAIGGVCGTALTYPLDVLRVRLAIGSTWQSAIQQGGMFQGLLPTILGVVPYAGTAWLAKQSLLEYWPTYVHRPPTITESLSFNALAG
jgi:solute carrier family 25, member 42